MFLHMYRNMQKTLFFSLFSGPPKKPPKWPKIVDFDPFQKTEGGDTSKPQKWPILAILPFFGLYGVDHNFRPDLAISGNRHVRGTPSGPPKLMIFDPLTTLRRHVIKLCYNFIIMSTHHMITTKVIM